MSYFRRMSESTFETMDAVRGAWNPAEQHIAPPMGLAAHVLERDHHARAQEPMLLSRIAFDILGVLPIEPVEVSTRVIRPGRSIELAEATLSHGGRAALTARGWFLRPGDTARFAGDEFPAIPPRDQMHNVGMPKEWQGEFVKTVDVLAHVERPGRGQFWIRPRVPLLEDEEISPTVRLLSIIDICNGLNPRLSPRDAAFPNLDLTADFFREPEGEWIGVDGTVGYGARGIGLTHSVLHDDAGAFGVVTQSLTVRPLHP
ncbi:MAG: thioesterase family protein [Microbacterium sp.]